MVEFCFLSSVRRLEFFVSAAVCRTGYRWHSALGSHSARGGRFARLEMGRITVAGSVTRLFVAVVAHCAHCPPRVGAHNDYRENPDSSTCCSI
jgi:hypothetical protein